MQRHALNIPREPLDAALKDLAQQTGLQIARLSDAIDGSAMVGPISGSLSAEEALQSMLIPQGLVYKVVNDRTIAVLEQADKRASTESTATEWPAGRPVRLAANTASQDAGGGAHPSGDSGTSREAAEDASLEEVTVFGRGVHESVRDIPQTVSVYDDRLIETTGSTQIQDIVRFVPTAASLTPDFSVTANSVNLRGFEASYTVNGMADAFANTTPDLVNVERVEVLMGPASVLYGTMEPGGVINIVTKAPRREFHADGSVTLGSFDSQRYALDVGGPLSERVRWRLSSSYTDEKSFITFWQLKRAVVAPSMAFDLGAATQLRIDGLYMRSDWPKGAYDGRVPSQGTVLPNGFGRIPRAFSAAEPQLDGLVRSKIDVRAYLDHRFNDAWSANLSLAYANQGYEGNTYFLLGLGEDGRSGRRNMRIDNDPNNPNRFAHLDLKGTVSTGRLEHRLIFGADYLRAVANAHESRLALESIDLFNPVYRTVVLPDPLELDEYRTTLEAYGVFAQDRLRIGDRLHLTAGVRYSDIRNVEVDQIPGSEPERNELSATNWASQVGLVYSATESLAVFASRNESFVPREGTTATGHPFDPEKGIQYELGSKLELGRTGMAGNLTLFQIEKPNVLANDPFNIGYLAPLGAVRSRGVELSANGSPAPGWTVYAAYAHLKAQVTESTEDAFAGRRLSNAPSDTVSLISSYEIQSGPLKGLGFSISGQHTGQRFADSANILSLPSYTRIDVAARYSASDNVVFSLSANNVTDEDIYTGFQSAVVSRQFGRVFFADLKVKL